MKKVAVLASGGDAPGMNAAIRAVARMSAFCGIQCFGVYWGYRGLITGQIEELGPRAVSNTVQLGGTILRTSRCPEFMEEAGMRQAQINLDQRGIEGLVVIGGDGSFRGACDFTRHWSGKIVGVPGTIDNDLYGTDYTIGYDTAVNTALDAIDKIRDTAESHGDRVFVVEVMGRHAGFIALQAGIGGGAEDIMIPETQSDIDALASSLAAGKQRGKTSSIVIVAEGDDAGGAFTVADAITKRTSLSCRVVVLGHLQRGGSPTAFDRVLATELGAGAVEALKEGISGVMLGKCGLQMCHTPLQETWQKKKPLDQHLLALLPAMAS